MNKEIFNFDNEELKKLKKYITLGIIISMIIMIFSLSKSLLKFGLLYFITELVTLCMGGQFIACIIVLIIIKNKIDKEESK